jgi:FixJ family two-component response regulator
MLEAAHAGVKSFLPKPYTADRLLKAIAESRLMKPRNRKSP